MNKLIAALAAGLFSFGVLAQTAAPAPSKEPATAPMAKETMPMKKSMADKKMMKKKHSTKKMKKMDKSM